MTILGLAVGAWNLARRHNLPRAANNRPTRTRARPRTAALPKEKHAPFVDGLMRMIRAAKPEEPAPLPKAKPRIRKPKLQKKAREVTEAIKEGTMPVDREAEPST